MSRDNAETFEDAFNLLCGDLIGSGISRHVYECKTDKTLVVKVENQESRDYFQNVIEWHLWGVAEDMPARRWFAPCVHLSPNGRLLLQRRTLPVNPVAVPRMMPVFLTDFKYANYGMHEGRVVCHDYGLSFPLRVGLRTTRMQKADWRD